MSVDPKIAEYRRQMAARYAQLSNEEKPRVAICEHCKRPEHERRVCLTTGLLHERDKMRLVGGMAMQGDKVQYSGPELMKALDASRVKWQKARVGTVKIDADASTFFQSFPLQTGWKTMRFGIMYGINDPPNRTVQVHAVYEPPQEGNEHGFRLASSDPREAQVDMLAKHLGLERVGVIVTHPPRDANEVVLSGVELLLAARDQSRFGDHCCIVTVAPDPGTKQVTAQGWQTTEQCVRLFQMGTLSPSQEQLGFVNSSIALEVAKDEKDSKGRPVCVVKEPSKEIDTRFMTAYCAIEQFHSDVVGNRFIRMNRPNERPLTFANVDAFCKDEKRAALPFHKKIRDFHLLIFLVEQMLSAAGRAVFRTAEADVEAMFKAMLKEDPVEMARFEKWVLEKCRQR